MSTDSRTYTVWAANTRGDEYRILSGVTWQLADELTEGLHGLVSIAWIEED